MIETDVQELFDSKKSVFDALYNAKEVNLQQKVKEKLHIYVYEFAQKKFFDDDLASDFYLYFIEKLDYIIERFDPDRGVRFSTFMSVYLHREIHGFYIKKNRTFDEHIQEIGWDSDISLHQKKPEKETQGIEKKIHRVLNLMTRQKGVSTKLYFGFSLKLFQFRYLYSLHKSLTFFTLFREYQKESREKHSKIQKTSVSYFSRLQQMEYRLYSSTDPDEEEQIRDQLDKVTARWLNGRGISSMSTVASLIKRSVPTTSRIISQGKNIIKRYIQKHGRGKVWIT